MPQMGESIAEGTIVRWIKKVGDAVDRDEPLFEISTDKVDAEIPSPVSGFVLDISVKEGETVPVNSVVAMIGEKGEAGATAPAAAAPARRGARASGRWCDRTAADGRSGARAGRDWMALRPQPRPRLKAPPRASVSARPRWCGASRRNTTLTCRGLPDRVSADASRRATSWRSSSPAAPAPRLR